MVQLWAGRYWGTDPEVDKRARELISAAPAMAAKLLQDGSIDFQGGREKHPEQADNFGERRQPGSVALAKNQKCRPAAALSW